MSQTINNEIILPINNREAKKVMPLWMLLLITFAAAVVGVFLIGWGYEAIASANNTPPPPVDTSYPKMQQTLEAKVDAAVEPQTETNPGELSSNFDDKFGSGKNNPQPSPNAVPNGALNIPMPPVRNSVPKIEPSSTPFAMNGMPNANTLNPATQPNAQPAVPVKTETALDRFKERNADIRRGLPVKPIAEIYDVEDVKWLGVVGAGRKELLFYSPVTGQTFSVPLTTRFRNGTLAEAPSQGNALEGVRFIKDNGSYALLTLANSTDGKTADSPVERPMIANEPVLVPSRQERTKISRKN